MRPTYVTTFSAPSNIAVVKYWGKRDAGPLNLPLNSSLSITMDQAELRAVTTVAVFKRADVVAAKSSLKDRLWLNGQEIAVEGNKRVETVLAEMRSRAKRFNDAVLHIVSANSFPTAAGLASSAAGYAALTIVLADVFQIPLSKDLTRVARMGSGSACRSLYGGLVAWEAGSKTDGADSVASPVAPKARWPLDITILVLNAAKKHTSSTEGMLRSVQTSALLGFRAKNVVSDRMQRMAKAYKDQDFDTFGEHMMRDSNQFHATCLDTYPPVFYLTDGSRKVINFVHAMNRKAGRIVAAYTFDAGPNAVIFTQAKDTSSVVKEISTHFPTGTSSEDSKTAGDTHVGVVKQIFRTRVGEGPRKLDLSLVDSQTGLPLPGYSKLI